MTEGLTKESSHTKDEAAPGMSIGNPQWRKISHEWNILYTTLCFVTLGFLPFFCFFYPVTRILMQTVDCSPDEADYLIVTLTTLESILPPATEISDKKQNRKETSKPDVTKEEVTVQHIFVDVFHYSNPVEHIVSMEIRTIRYCASSLDNYTLRKVPEVPRNFIRFLCDEQHVTSSDLKREEKRLLEAQYGSNQMQIPETGALEIIVRTAFNPFFLFQFFAVILWMLEPYYFYASLILVVTLYAIYALTSEELQNLERLRQLAGVQNTVQVLTDYEDEDDLSPSPLRPPSVIGGSSKNKSDVFRTIHVAPETVLVPGDRFLVLEGVPMPCDAVLISGRVVVDEGMLTGESIPVSKTPLELAGVGGNPGVVMTKGSLNPMQDTFDVVKGQGSNDMGNTVDDNLPEIDLALTRAGNILFAGTKVRKCHGGECIAVCYRTGFRSAKGQLISSLLNPREGFLTFFADTLLVILFMVILTTVLYIYIAVKFKSEGVSDSSIVFAYLDALTIAVPPALTASLSIATAVSIWRLKEDDIHVSDTSRINWAGTVSSACFDKTGTLTEETLNFRGACIVSTKDNAPMTISDCMTRKECSYPHTMIELMATCHNLAVSSESRGPDNKKVVQGDPLELALFNETDWELEVSSNFQGNIFARPPPTHNSNSSSPSTPSTSHGVINTDTPSDFTSWYKIIRHYEFTSERLRSATLLLRPSNQTSSSSMVYLVKGSPEVVTSLCNPSSIPSNLADTHKNLAKRGLRVIAAAHRDCHETPEELQSMTQDQLEALGNIHFDGLLVLSNRLKSDSKKTIKNLHAADISANMITGDYIFTAIAIATEVGILAPAGGSENVLYLVDEDDKGQLCIMDGFTDSAVDLDLEALVNLAAATSFDGPVKLRADNRDEDHRPLSKFPRLDAVISKLRVSTVGASKHYGSVQIAITGKGLAIARRDYSPLLVNSLVRYAKVFARMKPAEKKFVVEELMRSKEVDSRILQLVDATVASSSSSLSSSSTSWDERQGEALEDTHDQGTLQHVLFCGDGANDMIALRAATVGVSLCDAETSIAAPITSRKQTPGSVLIVLREGRCSLITAYVLVLFMIMYGIIQLFMVILLYNYGIIVGEWQYLTQDLFYTLVLGIVIAYNAPADTLSTDIPPKRFFSWYLMAKLFFQIGTFIAFQVGALALLSSQSFYVPYVLTDDISPGVAGDISGTYSYEDSTLQNLALGQLMIASVVASIDMPFRKPWYQNMGHVISLILQFGWLLFQLFGGSNYLLEDIFYLEPLPAYFAAILLGYIFLNAFVSLTLSWLADFTRQVPAKTKFLQRLGKSVHIDSLPLSPSASAKEDASLLH